MDAQLDTRYVAVAPNCAGSESKTGGRSVALRSSTSSNSLASQSTTVPSELTLLPTPDVQRVGIFRKEFDELRKYATAGGERHAVRLVNFERLSEQWSRWQAQLPAVSVFYAVKCNDDEEIIKHMWQLGAGFDCASAGEMNLVKRLCPGIGREHVIYSNPCKQVEGLQTATELDFDLTVFDNGDELAKVRQHYPGCRLLLRIATDDFDAQCPLSCKFGAQLDDCRTLLELSKSLEANVVGVHFHVGSGCSAEGAFSAAIKNAMVVFEIAEQLGLHFDTLNIGGGFPGILAKQQQRSGPAFEAMASEIRQALTHMLTAFPKLKLMAEPGRYFAASAQSVAVQVYSRRTPLRRVVSADGTPETEKYLYYVNESVYGAFNCIMFDHYYPIPAILATKNTSWNPRKNTFYRSTIFGQTCDGLDCIVKNLMMPEMEIGEWLVFFCMGAYTSCASSTFNGFAPCKPLYIGNTSEVLSVDFRA